MDKLIIDLFKAYYDARKNKRNTINALAFELEYEKNIIELYNEIKSGCYQLRPSMAFIVFKPVQREVFAADFRDRVVHHLIYNYLNPIFEPRFINDSYSCRKGRGTSYGIKRVDHFIRAGSLNYHADCYILKLDIKGYFMAMDRCILFDKITQVLKKYEEEIEFDTNTVLSLIKAIIFNDPTSDCIIKGSRCDWQGLPRDKSLFFAGFNKGFPIGNLTSQLFANIYLNEFDHFIKQVLKVKYYGRYVDDMVLIHKDKNHLKALIPKISVFLQNKLQLDLHPRKTYLQHYTKGVKFLGVIIKPYHILIQKRVKANLYATVNAWNIQLSVVTQSLKSLSLSDQHSFLASLNSYLGLLKQYKTFNLRKRIIKTVLAKDFWQYFSSCNAYEKIQISAVSEGLKCIR